MKKSLLKEAINISCNKILLHPEYDHYIHYSFIIQNNKIVEWGTNNRLVPAIHFGYQARLNDLNYTPKMHSEFMAYRKAKGLMRRNKEFEMINIRLNKNKELRISKPCDCCFSIMKELGCKRFYYSEKNGFIAI